MSQQNFSAVVRFKAVVGDSFSSAARAVRGDLSGVAEGYRDIRARQDKLHEFAGFDMRGLSRARREMLDARQEAARLERQMAETANPARKLQDEFERARRKADKTAQAYNSQRGRLVILNHELKKAGVNTRDLEGEFDRLGREAASAERRLKAMQGVLDAGVGGAFRNMAGAATRYAAVVGGSVGAVGAAVTMSNRLTAQQDALAQALGVSSEGFAAWGGIAREMGFEADNVGDLMEELNNKLGESAGLAEITPVTESLQILGLTFEELRDLKPEEQFRRVAEAVKGLDDHAQAVSAADILMGGEANKFFGYLRSRKEGVDELLARQKRLNVLSEEGRAGAQAYNTAFSRFSTVVASAAQEVSGLVGGALAPVVEEWGPKLADWIRENRDGFARIGDTVRGLVPSVVSFGRGLVTVFRSVGAVVSWVAAAVGGFDNLAVALGVVLGGKVALGAFQFGRALYAAGTAVWPLVSAGLPGLAAGIKAVAVAFASNPIGLVITGITLAVVRLITIWDDLKKSFAEGGFLGAVGRFFNVFGDDDSSPAASGGGGMGTAVPAVAGGPSIPDLPVAASSGGAQVSQSVGNINVYAAPGQSADEVAREVMRRLDDRAREAKRGTLYD
ncbi:phage tail tape measure protein [Desulfocurvus sp. DL9XJH121]